MYLKFYPIKLPPHFYMSKAHSGKTEYFNANFNLKLKKHKSKKRELYMLLNTINAFRLRGGPETSYFVRYSSSKVEKIQKRQFSVPPGETLV